MSGMFNPETFLNQTTDTSFETRRTPVPENEYIAVVDDIKFRSAKESIILDVFWLIDDAALAAKMGLPKVTVRQSIFLDITSDGRFETGPNKNIGLGRLREALGQNTGAWAPMQLKGAGPVKLVVINRPDDKDATIIYDDVKAITKLAA